MVACGRGVPNGVGLLPGVQSLRNGSSEMENSTSGKESQDQKAPKKGAWLGIGVALGVAFGVAMDNMGLGIALGICLGAAIEASRSRRAKD